MTPSPLRRGGPTAAALALLTVALVPGLAQLPAFASSPAPAAAGRALTLADPVAGLDDLDLRGTALPTATQRQAVAGLGAVDVRWNQFGTPTSLLPADGSLGPASSSDPVVAARTWLSRNAAVFGLTAGQVADLEVVNNQRLAQSDARAVLFRQRFGDLTPARASMVTVGVANGEIAYVSSSITRTTGTPAAAELSPLQAWARAAANVGRALEAGDLDAITSNTSEGWTRLTVPGFAQEQQVRLRALALADGSVRPVFEANVVDVQRGSAFAYTLMVDAVTGKILHRQNQAENSNDAFQFTGSVTATDCGPKHPFELGDANTRQIVAVANSVAPTDDVVVKIFDPQGELLVSGDLGTSPETATYTAESIPAGVYTMQVCPYDAPSVPVIVGPYTAFVTVTDAAPPAGGTALPSPRWRYFTANPSLDFQPSTTPTNSVIGCWIQGPGCTSPTGPFRNVAAFGPWDTVGGTPTLTTVGNNANTHEAWGSPLTPGGTAQAPISATREYTEEFTDAWNNSESIPAS
jgi:extracellular elastinolytic metalloproteinase